MNQGTRSAVLVAAGLFVLAACGGTPHSEAPSSSSAPGRGQASASASAAQHSGPVRVTASYATWRLPFRVSRSAAVAVGQDPRHLLLAGGMLPGDASTDRVIELDPTTGRHTAAPSLAVPVHDAAGGLLDGAPSVFGGGNATEQSLVQTLRGHAWRPAAHLPTTRSDLSVVTAGGSSLVIGGYDGAAVPREILRADRRLSSHGALRQGVRYAATAVVGQHAYVFGGEVDHRELGLVQRVDLHTGRTTVAGRLPRPLGHASAVTVDGRVLLLGGCIAPDRRTDAMWWYDPGTGQFTRAGRLPAALSDASVVTVGRHVWLLGGENPGVTDRVVQVTVL